MPNTCGIRISGHEYPMVWGNLALHRFRSIPVAQRNVIGPAQIAQFAWAAYKGVTHPFPTWEHAFAAIAELPEPDFEALAAAVVAVLPEPTEKPANASEKPEKEPSDAEKKSGSRVSEPSPVAASG